MIQGRLLLLVLAVAGFAKPEIRGAAMWSAGEVLTWGDGLEMGPVRGGPSRTLAKGDFGEGGCVVSLPSGSGVVLQEGRGPGRLVWLRAPEWRPEVIDTGMETHDCMEATLHGRHGVLVVHRYGQVRFYEQPGKASGRWPYREIYSFYTASHQGGLLMRDVDGDGRPDILCGNYWIHNPKTFSQSWRLYAIQLWFEQPDSALVRLAPNGTGVVTSQGEMEAARLAWFDPPADIHQQWIQHRIGEDMNLRRLHGLDTADLDGDGRLDIVTGENAGKGSRLLMFLNRGKGTFAAHPQGETEGTLFLRVMDVDGDKAPDIFWVGPKGTGWRTIKNK